MAFALVIDDFGVHGSKLRDHGIGISHEFGEFRRRALFFEGDDLDTRRTKHSFFQAEIRKGVVGDGYFGHGRVGEVIRR
jgi:hypothetical protein